MTPNAIVTYEGTINAQRLNKYFMCNRKLAQAEYLGENERSGKTFRSISSIRREILENEDQIVSSSFNIDYKKITRQAALAITVAFTAILRYVGF